MNDDKLKTLIPTLRQKKRFILFEIESSKKFDFKKVSEDLIEQIILYIGAVDFGNEGIWFLKDKFDEKKQRGVLKVSTKLKDKLVGVLAIINKIDNIESKIKVLKISGTFKGLENLK